jgi:hypothetical protein
LKEYRNRLKNSQYAKIHICNNLHRESMHIEVSNIENTVIDGVPWLEFDSIANQNKTHCKIRGGYVSEYHEYIRE